jgi:hypothetical protein
MASKGTKPSSLPPVPTAADEQFEKQSAHEAVPAHEAVQHYVQLRQRLEEAKVAFEDKHPQAVKELKAIREMQDEVQEAITAAKPLVAEAKESIGDFVCKRRFASAHYDNEKVTSILGTFENAGEVWYIRRRLGSNKFHNRRF